jgi:pimeloyl-ACP methyl ester carboxylesterase
MGYRSLLGTEYCTIAPDLPSHGKTPEPPGVSADNVVSCLAEGVVALAEREGREVHLVGHSFGAVVALASVLLRPDRFASLTLVEPVCFDALRLAGRFDLFATARDEAVALAALVAAGETERAIRLLLQQWGFGFWDVLSERQRHALVRAAPAIIGYGLLAAVRWPVSRETLRTVHVPTLLVYGDEGPEACAPIAKLLAREIPGAHAVCVQGAGHMLPITDRDRFAEIVRGHLSHVGERRVRHVG